MKTPKKIILGISGGIAAYKAPSLVRLLRRQGCEVKVVLTAAAKPLVGAEALRTVSGNPVFTDDGPDTYDMDHIRLAQWADVLLIAPATANTIAKIAHGIADNLLTTLALTLENKVIMAPAMNTAMWRNKATTANIETLCSRGVRVLPVESGELACGDEGPGRMLAIESIASFIESYGAPKALAGKKVLISSGPTQEAIDPVRYLSNRSSGRMGAALASAAMALGADVTVVSGPSVIAPPSGCTRIDVASAQEMLDAMNSAIEQADICIMAAAVSDFRPVAVSAKKLHRSEKGSVSLSLVPNPDIAAALGARKGKTFLAGFALEDTMDEKRAREKMTRKKCDLMILNSVKGSLGLDQTTVTMLYKNKGRETLAPMDKQSAAREILLRIAKRTGRSDG